MKSGGVVIISGNSAFIPAEKLAGREGIGVVLGSMWGPIHPKPLEHADGIITHAPKPKPALQA